MKKGFTLIELLVGLTIILAIGTMVFAVFVATLRSTNKTVSNTATTQNGSYALTQIARAVRNAKQFGGVSLTGDEPFTASCVMPNGPTPPFTKYKAIKIINFDDEEEIYRCPDGSETGIYYNDESLINTNLVSAADATCSLTCVQTSATSIPVIGIDFTISSANQTGAVDTDSTETFTTSVSPRNYSR